MTGKSNPNESISSTILKQNGALNAMVITVWLHLGRLECSRAVLWSVLRQNRALPRQPSDDMGGEALQQE